MGLFSELLGFVLLSEMLLYTAQGSLYHYDFVLKETNFTRLCHTKSILTVNDSFPGPVIRVHKGDTVFVNVHNHGFYGVTLHWHGVKQPRNPWADGPEYITQCPIPPRSNFTYEVHFSVEEGTLWWHAHSDWTRATVHGAIVVLPAPGTTYPFPKPDEEEVIVIGCWYKGNLYQLVKEALETGGDTPRSIAYTINGQPGDLSPCSREGTHRFLVDYGKTYLLRIVNAVTNADLFFAIAQHNLTVVGTDGAYVKPIATDIIMISPGQTMDVLITANQTLSQYYMAARQYSSTDPAVTQFDYSNVTAILQYRGSYIPPQSPYFPSVLPVYKDDYAAMTFKKRIRSLANRDHPIDVPRNITTRMYITASMNTILCPNSSCEGMDGNKLGTSMNNFSFQNPSRDILLAYYRNISGVYDTDFPDFPPSFYNFTGQDLPSNTSIASRGTKVKVLDYNEQVEIVFQGTNVLAGAECHPMHLHGYSFYVIGMGLGNFDLETDPKGFNLVDPPMVNTFGIPKYGWLAIRFTANNPGVWYLHCHFDRHMSWGMDTTFIVKNGRTAATSMRDPPAYLPPCDVVSDTSLLQALDVSDGTQKTSSAT